MNIFVYFPMGKSYKIMKSQLVYKNTYFIATTHPDLVYGTGNAEHGCGISPRLLRKILAFLRNKARQ